MHEKERIQPYGTSLKQAYMGTGYIGQGICRINQIP